MTHVIKLLLSPRFATKPRRPLAILHRFKIWLTLLAACQSIATRPSLAQPAITNAAAYTFTTLAGYPGFGSTDGVGSHAEFHTPLGLAVDGAGNIYVADSGNSTIRRITQAGVVTTINGLAGISGSADGVGGAARFSGPFFDFHGEGGGGPWGVASDVLGDIYVADTWNHTIRKSARIGTNWVVTTIAGRPGSPGSTDGTNAVAQFNYPQGIVVDPSGNIYVADGFNFTIRKVTQQGTNWLVSTIAGLAGSQGSADGAGSTARFSELVGIALDSAGNLYVADTDNDTIRKITPIGNQWVVETIAGSAASPPGNSDGTNSASRFFKPQGVAVDGTGNVYVTDSGNFTLRKVMPSGKDWVVTTLAGLALGSADGTGTNAQFSFPTGIAVDSAGNIFVSDTSNNTIRKSTSAGIVRTLAGLLAGPSGVDGTGNAARFNDPFGVTVDTAGNVYVADTFDATLRQITSAGEVSTLAGLSQTMGTNDGVGSNSRFFAPVGIALDAAGNIYVADALHIRKVTYAGVVTSIAGLGGSQGSTDGTNSTARFYGAYSITVDKAGNLYVTDTFNDTIRKITPVVSDWVVTTIAGLAQNPGSTDGTNSDARFDNPDGITVDCAGNLYVTDSANFTIRILTPAGTNWVVRTIAGLAGSQGSDDGVGSSARFYYPFGIAAAETGDIYVGDRVGHTIRKMTRAGTDWVVTTLAGLARAAGSVDGAGSGARFDAPAGVAVDREGNLYVADSGNNSIRKGTLTAFTSTNVVYYVVPAGNAQLAITLLPKRARGQWRFPWEQGWRNSGQVASNLIAGNYPIEFRNVPGWLPIPPRVTIAVTNTGTTPLTNLYYPTIYSDATNGGILTVNIGPSPPAGVGWRFIGDLTPFPAYPPGYSTNLLPGTYLIEFAPVSGYSKPPSQAVQIAAGQPTVVAETYLLARSAPSGVLLPIEVPANNISNLTAYPFGFNGQLQSDVGYGSGVAVLSNVVLTAAHLVFNDQTLSYASHVYWFFQEETDVFMPEPLLARSWYVLDGYASQRTNDVRGGLGPDQSSPQSRNMDVAALYFDSHVAGGGYGGYLPSDEVPNSWLSGMSLKMLVGYPIDASQFGDSSIIPGKMYQTDPQPYPLGLANDPVSNQRVYTANWFLTYPGNSGGPLYVQFNGYYYPAAVYLGTLYSGVDPYASAVRAIDSDVVNLITIAANEGISGTNHTGGGVITFIPGAVSTSNPGYVQFQLTPAAAVQQGAAWRLQGDSTYSTAANYTRAVTSTNAFNVEFKPIAGWNLPTNQSLTVQPGLISVANAFYAVTNPVLVADLVLGLGITGTTGTVYRIENRSLLGSGSWLPLSTNAIISNGINPVLPVPLNNQGASYYRVVWLP
jgi:sugar lactone lactonase YvrE